MRTLALAVLLSIAAAAVHAVAAVVQERLAAGLVYESRTGLWRRNAVQLLRRGRWWVAVGLSGTAAIGHVLALRYGPLTIVQLLGALTLVLALPLSAAVGGRRVTTAAWSGAVMTLVGLAGLLALASSASPSGALTASEAVLLTAATVLALVILATWASATSNTLWRGLCYAAAAGICFGVCSALTRTLTVQVADDGITALVSMPTVVVAVLVTCGLLLSQAAYRAGLAAPLAAVTVVNPIAAAVIGVGLLDERYVAGPPAQCWS